jgi:hypothetical protein
VSGYPEPVDVSSIMDGAYVKRVPGRTEAGTWAPCGPPFSSYEATDGQPDGRAQVRSIDRVLAGGRRCKGQRIAQSLSTRGYPRVTIRDDDGVRHTIEVHALVMMAHEPGPCPPAFYQVRHWNDVSTDNRWAPGGEAAILAGGPGNLVYGDAKQQWDDKLRNRPSPPSWSRRVKNYLASRLKRWFV